ncbi:MAG: hypothetical protein R3D68_07890 [Hyphomicrobiaceae bacterium]
MAGEADDFRIDIDLDHAAREAARIRDWLSALRRRHDLSRFEYTRLVQIVPAGPTHSHPILTLGTRFTETEDLLLATYLHEQMHWYLWLLGGPDHDPIAPFYDELVRRYPKAPIKLPEGARNYEQTYLHLVVCWLEVAAVTELIGRERAEALCDTQWGYRWIYRTVVADREALGALLREHGIYPMRPPGELTGRQRPVRGEAVSAVRKRNPRAAAPQRSRRSRRRPPGRGGTSAG